MKTQRFRGATLRQADGQDTSGGLAQVANWMRMGRAGTLEQSRPSQPFSQISVVFSCVKARAEAMASMPLRISDSDDRALESGPLVDLAERPNPKLTGRAFRRNTSSFLDIFGVCFWAFVLDAAGRPNEIYMPHPAQMAAVRDKQTGEISGWKYRAYGNLRGEETFLPASEVHVLIDPDFSDPDPLASISPMRAARMAISQIYKADIANEANLDHGMEPGGALILQGGYPSEKQIENLRTEILERYRGPANRRRMLMLYGGWDWKPFSVSLQDMQFAELKKFSREDVCSAFGVPPAVLGFFEGSNYAHATAAEQGFWNRTILPRANWISEEFDLGVLSRFAGDQSLSLRDARRVRPDVRQSVCEGLRHAHKAAKRSGRMFYAWFDSSSIGPVRDSLLAQVQQATQWAALGVPLNAILDALDAPFAHQPWGNTWWKPIGTVNVRDELSPGSPGFPGSTPGAGGSPLESDPPGSDAEVGLIEEPQQAANQAGLRRDRIPDAQKRISLQMRGKLWHAWRRSLAGLDRVFKSRVRGHFHKLRTETLQRLHQAMPEAKDAGMANEKRDLIGSILFDLVPANKNLTVKLSPLYREATRLGGEQSMKEAADAKGQDEPDQFDINDPVVEQAIRSRTIRIAGVNHTLRK